MKSLSFTSLVLFIVNIIVGGLLLCAYTSTFAFIQAFSVISLASPLLIFINVLFCVYWLIRLKLLFLFSLVVLLLGMGSIRQFYRFSANPKSPKIKMRIMSYNVRLFNAYGWIKNTYTDENIISFITSENPDIVCIQEFYSDKVNAFENYPYKFIKLKKKGFKMGLAILSKFPITYKGSVNFPNSNNNAIFADIQLWGQVVRVYNVHLQSLSIDQNYPIFDSEESKKLAKKMSLKFSVQKEQVALILESLSKSPNKKIICGDFNNTVFSYVYKRLSRGFKDSFVEAGEGFSNTFVYKGLPLRIDYILVDTTFGVSGYKNYDVKHSDHKPILAEIYPE